MNLFQQSFEIWQSGGVLMLPLAALAFVIYWTALDLYYQFNNGRLLGLLSTPNLGGRTCKSCWRHP